DPGVEVQADDRAAVLAALEQRGERSGQRLERERAGLEGRDRAARRGVEEPAAERILGCESDRVQYSVKYAPARVELRRDAREVVGLIDVELEHVGAIGQVLGGALGQTHPAAKAAQHDLSSLLLRLAGDLEGDRAARQHARDQQALAAQHVHSGMFPAGQRRNEAESSAASAAATRARVSLGVITSSTWPSAVAAPGCRCSAA